MQGAVLENKEIWGINLGKDLFQKLKLS